MPGSSFGRILTLTTFGESHGPAVGGVLDGVPPGIPLSEADVQRDLDRRRPGQSAVTTERAESDTVAPLLSQATISSACSLTSAGSTKGL